MHANSNADLAYEQLPTGGQREYSLHTTLLLARMGTVRFAATSSSRPGWHLMHLVSRLYWGANSER